MATRNAGSAAITIRPDMTDFIRELQAKLTATNDPGFTISVSADIADAQRDTEQFRAEESRKGVEVKVDARTTTAEAELVRFRKAQELQSIRMRIEFDEASAIGKLRMLQKQFDGVGGKLGSGLKINLGALGIGSLPAIATAAADVAGALQQVAQAGLVLPGVMAGIASSVGTAVIGFQGMGDALKAVQEAADGTPESMAKAEEALKKLSPAAREVVTTLAGDVVPQLKALQRDIVQQNMFEGVASSITDLTGRVLPTFERGLGGIATAWNSTFKELARVGGSDASLSIMDRIFGNTAEAQTRANAAIEPLVRGIGTLTAAGTDALPRLADGLTAVSERFANFITAADDDGRLDEWINDGLDGLTSLGNTILNLGKTFTGVTEAAGGGAGLLGTIENLTGRLATFVNSTEGQDKLKQFFQEGREQLAQWGPILLNVADVFGDIYNASKAWTDAILPPLTEITGFLADHPALIETAASAFIAFKTVDGVASLATSLSGIADMLGVGLPGAASKGASGISAALGRVAVPAWLAYLVGQQNPVFNNADVNAAIDAGNNGNQKPIQDIFNQVDVDMGNKPAPRPPSPARTNDLPYAGRQPTIPGLTTPGPAAPSAPFVGNALDPNFFLGPKKTGGPTPSRPGRGPTGGYYAELHPNEYVVNSRGRAVLGDDFLAAANGGRLPSLDTGGFIDQYGNPVNAGTAPGAAPIAPNPTTAPQSGGGLNSIIGNIVSGIQGPIGNALALGHGLANSGAVGGVDPTTTVHGTAAGALPGPAAGAAPAMPSLADRAAGIPGLWGLIGSLGSSNPAENLMNWGTNTASWLGNFATGVVGSLGSTLWQGALGFFGIENSILSPNNRYNQAIAQSAQFALGQDGPLGALLGMTNSGTSLAVPTQQQEALDPKRVREAQDKITDADGRVAETLARLNELPADAKESTRIGATNAHNKALRDAQQARDDLGSLMAGGSGLASSGAGILGNLDALPSRGGENGLQVNTIRTKRAIEAMFPQITDPIGGYRQDPLKWHPNGLALDVMIPGGTVRGGANPAGEALGDRIWAWVNQHADELGVDMGASLWKTDSGGDHYNHLHIATTGGGYPSLFSGGPTPNTFGPMDGKGGHLAVVHPREYVISARGRATVPDAFLHKLNAGQVNADELPGFALGGPINIMAGMVQPPRPRPNFNPGPGARTITPRPAAPVPAPRAVLAQPQQPTTVASTAPAPTPPTAAAAPGPSTNAPRTPALPNLAVPVVAPASGSTNHLLPWMSTAIQSGAATIGSLAASAASMGIGAAGGGAGAGLAGSLIQGGIMQAGKIAEDAANVVASLAVGSVPGSFGDPNLGAYGRVNLPEQNRPATAEWRGAAGGNTFNTFNGYEAAQVLQMQANKEALDRQARLANIPH